MTQALLTNNGALIRSGGRCPALQRGFAFTSPYGGCWLEHYYRNGCVDLFGAKVKTERHFQGLISQSVELPRIVILGNFIVERHAIQSLCRELGIDTICSEDGFFPHYETLHADPLGFAWESSLPRIVYRRVMDRQRSTAHAKRAQWLQFERRELPVGVRRPFVLWPLQLIGDQVNRWDLNLSDWSCLLSHFRACLPSEYQLVVKPHPRSKGCDDPTQSPAQMPNTVMLPKGCDLQSLIEQSSALAGANSTVLMEARLMFHKPAYTYARSWFTNHEDLFTVVSHRKPPRPLNRLDHLDDNRKLRSERLDDYTDWFLYQLLARQFDRAAAADWDALNQWMLRRTYRSFIEHGEEVFE